MKHIEREAGDSDRELWDPAAEALAADDRAARVQEGLARQWRRVWEQPIPFYREKFAAAGLTDGDMPNLDDIPLTRKDELRRNEAEQPPFGSHRSVGLEQAARVARSTGTTGKPWNIFYTEADLRRYLVISAEHSWRTGLRPGRKFAHSWPGYLYPTGVLGGRQYLDMGVLEIPMGIPFSPQDAEQHVLVMQELGFDCLMCTYSQLQIYDQAANSLGIELPNLLEGKTLVVPEAMLQFEGPRRRVQSLYGFGEIHNVSGASEAPGLVTSDSRRHSGLVVPSNHYHIQACDPVTGKEVANGQPGTLVINSFDMDALWLRYDLEDTVVILDEPCPSGSTCQRYRYLGRMADAATVQGRKVLPLEVQIALDEFDGPEFVMAAGEQDQLRLQVEAAGRGADIRDKLQAEFSLPVELVEVEAGSLPRAAFKPRRIVK